MKEDLFDDIISTDVSEEINDLFTGIYDIDDFMKELKKIIKNFLNENPLSCVMTQSSICFNIDDFMQSLMIESTEEFKQEIEKFFYEDEEN